MPNGRETRASAKESSVIDSGPVWAHAALLVVAAMALTYPCLTQGLPEGHDRVSHLSYQHFFNEQIAAGDLYPRWMPGLNGGLGGGIFFMQYPLPYYVAWGLGHIFPNHWGIYTETRTQGLAIVLATILAGLFTYGWCATFTDHLSALMAGLVYVTLPYFLSIDLYMRISVGEFWALSVLPLSLLFVERMRKRPRQSQAGLAVAFALALLSHLFTAALLGPVLVVYAVWRAEPGRRILAAIQTAAALALGTGLAGVYILPALANRSYLHLENFIAAYGGNYSPLSQMFLLNPSIYPKAGRGWIAMGQIADVMGAASAAIIIFGLYLSQKKTVGIFRLCVAIVSCLTLSLTVLASFLQIDGDVSGALPVARYLVEQRAEIFLCSFLTLEAALLCYWSLRDGRHKGLANFLVLLALGTYLMMTSASQLVWKALPILWTIQFPWRLNVFLLAATAGLAALATSELLKAAPRTRLLGAALALAVWAVAAGGTARLGTMRYAFQYTRPIAYEPSRDVALPIYAQANPQEALLVKFPDDGKVHAEVTIGNGQAEVDSVRPRLMELSAKCASDCTLQIGQFYWPEWRAQLLPGRSDVPLRAGLPAGLMEVSLPAGEHRLELALPRGWAERSGAWLSAACMIIAALIAITGRDAAGQRDMAAHE